jgi:DNA-binding CsgD family transcriptional regulator
MRQVPAESRKKPTSDSGPAQNPQDLFRLLIEQLTPTRLSHPQSSDPAAEEADNIVLDVELDGHRYLLMRTVKASRAPVELSPREKEIARMVAQGHPNKIIAGVLNISSWTVCTHLRRVFAKLGVTSRAAMVARLHELEPFTAGMLRRHSLNASVAPVREAESSTKPTSIAPRSRQTA